MCRTNLFEEPSREELFIGQEFLIPPYQRSLYKYDSTLTPATAPRDKVRRPRTHFDSSFWYHTQNILLDLPNGTIIVNCRMKAGGLAYILSTDLYIAILFGLEKPRDDEKMKQWLRMHVQRRIPLQYLADYDASQRKGPVTGTDSWSLILDNDFRACESWQTVKQKYH